MKTHGLAQIEFNVFQIQFSVHVYTPNQINCCLKFEKTFFKIFIPWVLKIVLFSVCQSYKYIVHVVYRIVSQSAGQYSDMSHSQIHQMK